MNRRTVLLAAVALSVPVQAATADLVLHGSAVRLEIDGKVPDGRGALIESWVRKSADAVARYYGKFPVPRARIKVLITEGVGIGGGTTFPGSVPVIEIRVGRDAPAASTLTNDWVMVHEMIHLAFPYMDGKHNWMAEGIAVYVESIARVQAGHVPEAQIWRDFAKAMPKALPKDNGGLDVTTSWGMTYWGGALFCLLANIAIRQQTDNPGGLQQALRAINAVRDFRRDWNFRETLAIGDAATGHQVLGMQYEAMRDTPLSIDLPALWTKLGVAARGDTVIFDETAPLAAIRKAITSG
ncbi:MAG: hypothetical protein H7X89_03955 [Rhizobiales bacterium]|nr:hypothetical protein [Hyphomicrobiales bacterium]